MFPVSVVTVERTPGVEVDVQHPLMGRGVAFPSGVVAIEWYRDAFPPEDRLEGDHLSFYDSIDDVERATGGRVTVDTIIEYEVPHA